MNTCKTCKNSSGPTKYGERYCENPKLNPSHTLQDDELSAGGHGITEMVQVGADFGCVHHEEKG